MLISASSDAEFGFLPCPFAHDTQQQEAQQPTPDLKHLHLLVLQPPLQPQQVRPGSAAARESAVRCVHAQGNSPTSLVRVFLPTAQPALPSTAQITKIRSPVSNSRSRLLSPPSSFPSPSTSPFPSPSTAPSSDGRIAFTKESSGGQSEDAAVASVCSSSAAISAATPPSACSSAAW